MKKAYNAPKLTIYGSVEEITQAVGQSSASDTIFFNGQPIQIQGLPNTGSRDGQIQITPRGNQLVAR
jgi:hypothetical protein